MVQDNRKTTEIAYFWTELWSLDLFQCFMRYCGRNLQSISSPASGDKRRQSLPFREGSRETWRAREGLLQWGNRPSEIWRTLMISWILCLDFCSSTGDISWEACWKPCWCSKRGAALDTNHAVLLLGCAGILMDTHRNRWSGQQLCTFFCFYLINFPAGGCWYPFWTISCWVTHQAFQLPIRSTSQCKASRCKRPGVLSAARGICGVAMGSPLSNPLGTHVAFRKWATHVAFQMIAAFRDATLEQLLVAWPQTTEVLLDPVFSVTVSESERPLLMLWPIWASDWGWNSAETAVAQGLGRDGHQTNGKTSRVWVWDCQVFSSR